MKGWLQWQLSRQNGAFAKAFWNARNLAEAEQSPRSRPKARWRSCARPASRALREMRKDGAAAACRTAATSTTVLERRLRAAGAERTAPARKRPDGAGQHRLDRAFRGPVRHGVGHHARAAGHQPDRFRRAGRGGRPDRRSPDRHRHRHRHRHSRRAGLQLRPAPGAAVCARTGRLRRRLPAPGAQIRISA